MIRKALIRGWNVPDAVIELEVSSLALMERMVRTGGLVLAMLLATAVSALIPIIDFIAVPLMLIATVIVGISSLNRTKVIKGGAGKCPHCDSPFRIYPRRYTLPFTDVCEHCHRQVSIVDENQSAVPLSFIANIFRYGLL